MTHRDHATTTVTDAYAVERHYSTEDTGAWDGYDAATEAQGDPRPTCTGRTHVGWSSPGVHKGCTFGAEAGA